jgi:hypothetical protein
VRKNNPPRTSDTLSSEGRLASAQAALEDANRKLAGLNEKRNQCLLGDDNAGAIALAGEMANLKLAARAEEDRIALLRAQAAEEEKARKVREREGLIKQIEEKLAARDAAGADLADAAAKMNRSFFRMIDLGREVQGLWNWPPSDLAPILAIPPAISAALCHELYRISAHPKLLGGQVEKPNAGLSLPGSKVPRFELTHLPEKITPLASVLQEATAYALGIMRGQKLGAPAAGAVSAPLVINGSTVPRSESEQRLASLLKRMNELAEDPARESEYNEVVAAITLVQDELTATKQMESQGGS